MAKGPAKRKHRTHTVRQATPNEAEQFGIRKVVPRETEVRKDKTSRVKPNRRMKGPPPLDKHFRPEIDDPRNTTSYWEYPPYYPPGGAEEERVSQLQLAAVRLWWDGSCYEEIGRVLYDKDDEAAAKAKSVVQMTAKHFGVGIEDLREAIVDSRLRQIADEFRARGMDPESWLVGAMRTGRRSG